MKNRNGAFVASAMTAVALFIPSVGMADDKLTIGVIELFGGEFFTEARKGINDVATRGERSGGSARRDGFNLAGEGCVT